MQSKRILCLDVGGKRIGVAASDPLGITAQGIGVIERKSLKNDFEKIASFCKELEPILLLVGLPLDEEGGEGKSAKSIRNFADKLAAHLKDVGIDVKMEFWDERYSTKVAEERLIAADVSRAKRRRVIDKMAAVVILEGYLNEKNI